MFTGIQGECVYKLAIPEGKGGKGGKEKEKTKGKDKQEGITDIGNVSVVITWLNPYVGTNSYEVKVVAEQPQEAQFFVATYQV